LSLAPPEQSDDEALIVLHGMPEPVARGRWRTPAPTSNTKWPMVGPARSGRACIWRLGSVGRERVSTCEGEGTWMLTNSRGTGTNSGRTIVQSLEGAAKQKPGKCARRFSSAAMFVDTTIDAAPLSSTHQYGNMGLNENHAGPSR